MPSVQSLIPRELIHVHFCDTAQIYPNSSPLRVKNQLSSFVLPFRSAKASSKPSAFRILEVETTSPSSTLLLHSVSLHARSKTLQEMSGFLLEDGAD